MLKCAAQASVTLEHIVVAVSHTHTQHLRVTWLCVVSYIYKGRASRSTQTHKSARALADRDFIYARPRALRELALGLTAHAEQRCKQ